MCALAHCERQAARWRVAKLVGSVDPHALHSESRCIDGRQKPRRRTNNSRAPQPPQRGGGDGRSSPFGRAEAYPTARNS